MGGYLKNEKFFILSSGVKISSRARCRGLKDDLNAQNGNNSPDQQKF